jgi:hypothetical protein
MDANEHLEKVVAPIYAWVLEQEENVYRTLPFAATALAVIFTFMIFVKGDIPDQLRGLYPSLIWVTLCLFWLAIATALAFLWLAVARKPLQYLSVNELYRYVNDLRSYYTTLGTPSEQIEQRVIEDTRTLVIEQYTFCVTYNGCEPATERFRA